MTQKQTEASEPRHSKGNLSHRGTDIDVDSFLRTHPSLREPELEQPAPEVPPADQKPEPYMPIRDAEGRALLGKKFLDATNHWKRNPEAPIDDQLSIEGKAYISEIKWVFDRLEKDIASKKGRVVLESNPVISGMPLDEYLMFIKEKLQYEEEYDHIRDVVREAQYSLNKAQLAALAEFPAKHVFEPAPRIAKPAPQLSTIERIEALQAIGRGERFSPPPQKGNQ